jgi:hypothetical protein
LRAIATTQMSAHGHHDQRSRRPRAHNDTAPFGRRFSGSGASR